MPLSILTWKLAHRFGDRRERRNHDGAPSS
jgi:hypothetical protein